MDESSADEAGPGFDQSWLVIKPKSISNKSLKRMNFEWGTSEAGNGILELGDSKLKYSWTKFGVSSSAIVVEREETSVDVNDTMHAIGPELDGRLVMSLCEDVSPSTSGQFQQIRRLPRAEPTNGVVLKQRFVPFGCNTSKTVSSKKNKKDSKSDKNNDAPPVSQDSTLDVLDEIEEEPSPKKRKRDRESGDSPKKRKRRKVEFSEDEAHF